MQTAPPLVSTFSWALQFTLSLGTALGATALALTFRRPATRVLAAAAGLGAVASGFIWLGLSARGLGFGDAAGAWLILGAFPLSPWVIALLQFQLIQLVALRTDRAWPRWQVVVGVGGGALALGAALASTGTARSPTLIAAIASVGSMLVHVAFTGLAFRWATTTGSRSALRYFGVSFALLAVRSMVNLGVASTAFARGEPPEFGVGVTTVQLMLFTLAYVLQLVAVLEDERTAIESAAERLRAAEASRATSERLESLGRMAGGVSHDFNNLLSVISMSAANARAAAGPDAAEDLQLVVSAAQRGQELTRQLVAFARQAPQEVSRFDANERLGRMTDLLRRMTGKDHAFDVVPASAPMYVNMDASQFDQVLMNLVANARDATPAGGSVSVRTADAPPGWYCLSVADTGTGIPADVLPHIFEPFYSTKEADEGTGLGLATCEGIVRRAGGRIEVHSETGRGTRFDVLLPRASAT